MAEVAIYAWDGNEDSIPFAVKDEETTPMTLTIIQGERKVFDDTDPETDEIIADLQTEKGTEWSVYSGNPNSWPPPKPF